MTDRSKRILLWLPRVLAMVFIGIMGVLALDAAERGAGLWGALAAVGIHLIPAFVMLGVLVLAWRWEWVGALLFAGAGVLYAAMVLPRPNLPAETKLLWCALVAGPALLIGALFLVSWLKHDELRRPSAPGAQRPVT
jgi:hypothetical protein